MRKFPIRPVSSHFGYDRGKPIDRYYIEKFLDRNKEDIKGRVLEIGDNNYTKMFGKDVTMSDVLNPIPSKESTIVGNLATGENIPISAFDCIILTQVLHVIYDVKSSLYHTIEALKPGAVLLLTTTGLSQDCRCESYGDFWRFTDMSLNYLLSEILDPSTFEIKSFGNVAVAKAFLDGLALHEIPEHVLDYNDPNYQVILTVKIKK